MTPWTWHPVISLGYRYTCLHLARRCYETQGLLKASHLQQEVGQSACLGKWQQGHLTYVVLTIWLKFGYRSHTTIVHLLEENTLTTSSRFRVFHEHPNIPHFPTKEAELKHLKRHKTHHLWDVSGRINKRWWDHKNQMLWVEGKTLDMPGEEMNPDTF